MLASLMRVYLVLGFCVRVFVCAGAFNIGRMRANSREVRAFAYAIFFVAGFCHE
jgi:hypothetical protein